MKICRFDGDHIGWIENGQVHDITQLAMHLLPPDHTDGDALILALPALLNLSASSLRKCPSRAIEQTAFASPIRNPTKIIAAPVNYRAHVAEANADPGIRYGHTQTDIREAGLFLKANSSLCGAADGVCRRFPGRRTDYEAELVIVIGRKGSDIAAADALSHVAGYCVGLDITLRGPEDRSFRKSIDTYSVVGPWLTTADEISNPDELDLSLTVNGEPKQRANTRDMVLGVAGLIEYASSFYTLNPGDLIFTGTPEGVGPINPGDILVASLSGLGNLQTKVRAHDSRAAQLETLS